MLIVRQSFLNTCFILVLLLSIVDNAKSQQGIPDVQLESSDGKSYNLGEFNNGKPTVMVFWATWCKPCIEELDNIADYYSDWTEQADFNFLSVCIDDSRTSSAVKGFLHGRDWPFLVLMDENQDFKRTMNVADIPFYCIYNKEGKIVKRHTGYLPGDEEFMFEALLEYSNEE